MANGHGGARPGAGRPVGTLDPHTLAKRANREKIRAHVEERLKPILEAQTALATGLSYMLIRHEDGTFSRAQSAEDIDEALKRGGGAFQILTQQPHQGAASMLLSYAADKAVEPIELSGPEGGALDLVMTLKERHAKHRPSTE